MDRGEMEIELARVRAMLDRMAGRRLEGALTDAQEVHWRILVNREYRLVESLRSD
jgi:hypothetical protein